MAVVSPVFGVLSNLPGFSLGGLLGLSGVLGLSSDGLLGLSLGGSLGLLSGGLSGVSSLFVTVHSLPLWVTSFLYPSGTFTSSTVQVAFLSRPVHLWVQPLPALRVTVFPKAAPFL